MRKDFKVIFFVFLLVGIFASTDGVAQAESEEIVELGKELEEKTLQVDTLTELSTEKLENIKAYIAHMEQLLKKNAVSFSQEDIAKKGAVDKRIKEKLKELKEKVETREKAINEKKQSNNYLIWSIVIALVFIIPLILFVLFLRHNKKEKKKNVLLENRNKDIKRAYSDITSSLNYAKKIQNSILVRKEVLTAYVDDAFVLNNSKELVNRNFYWFAQVNNRLVIAVADCKISGVSGALMAMMGVSFLNEIVKNGKETNPSKILKRLDTRVKKSLNSNAEFSEGINIALVTLCKEEEILLFAGANIPLHHCKGKDAMVIKPENKTIGEIRTNGKDDFALHQMKLSEVDKFYLFTNAYHALDEEKEQHFYYSAEIERFITSVKTQKMEEEYEQLNNVIDSWGGRAEGNTITALGVKIK